MSKHSMTNELRGFGTYCLTGDRLKNALRVALCQGANLLDVAEAYKNLPEICECIRTFEQNRPYQPPLMLFYKIWLFSGESATQRVEHFRKAMLSDHFLIVAAHWPSSTEAENFRLLEELIRLKENGIIQGVGLSNFSYEQCRIAYQRYGNLIWGLESEMHPFYQNTERLLFCKDHGWKFVAASPLYRNQKRNLTLEEMAQAHGISTQQIMLLWSKQCGAIPIPRSSNPEHIFNCLNLPPIHLSDKEMRVISTIPPIHHLSRICLGEN